ncbi:MAG TPA: hypothetical protein VER12_06605, partial [Polyangiaceae bacterium]|nr:hypothetical protein [Polyangiaceae bacterium]
MMKARIVLGGLGGWLLVACQVALGDFTIDTTKLAVSCESGSLRCAAKQLQSCVSGNEWRVLATCPLADSCNLRSLNCAACEPGSYQCNGSQPQLCDAGSHWVTAGSACASASLCDVPEDGSPANCKPPGCPAAGQVQCQDGHLQRCPLSQTSWQDIEICASPALCDLERAKAQLAAGKPATCVLPSCSAGQFNCDTGSPRPCKADRTGWDTATTSCAGATCNAATGDCSECAIGSYVCSGQDLKRCGEQRTWETSSACSSALACNTGATPNCDPPSCTPGEFRCNTISALERCRSDGTKWEPIEQCMNRVLCNPNATRCEVPRCPGAGAKRCQGNTQQTCRADLTGWDELIVCPASGSCDPERGCLDAPCSSGAYRCNDVSLETCSNGAWTRLASCQTSALCNASLHVCTAPSCAPGERQCQGNVLRRCNAARDGWDELETCSGHTKCSPETKRCEQG